MKTDALNSTLTTANAFVAVSNLGGSGSSNTFIGWQPTLNEKTYVYGKNLEPTNVHGVGAYDKMAAVKKLLDVCVAGGITVNSVLTQAQKNALYEACAAFGCLDDECQYYL